MSRNVGFAVIGAGRIGALHAETLFSLPKARLVAVVDPDREAALRVAEDRLAATTIDAAFKNPEVDAVVIASPTDLHAEHIIAAARAGKAIFCEKPVSLDLARAEEAMRVVEETQVPFQVGFQRRFDPGFATAKRRLDSIGRLEMLRMQSCDPRPASFEYLKSSGGIFCDMTIHDIDLARFFGGDIVEVTAIGSRFVVPELEQTDDVDTAILTLRFASGALGVIQNSRRAVYGYDIRTELFGEKGKLVVEQEQATALYVYDAAGVHRDYATWFIDRFRTAYVGELGAFVAAVREGRTPSPGASDAIESLRVALAATRSLREGRAVKVDEVRSDPAAGRGDGLARPKARKARRA